MYIMFDYILLVLLWLFAITLIVFLSYKLKRLTQKHETLKKCISMLKRRI
jgi:flagellar biogenesis protein FliO